MSVNNLFTDGIKSWQNLNVNTLTSQNVISSDILVSGGIVTDQLTSNTYNISQAAVDSRYLLIQSDNRAVLLGSNTLDNMAVVAGTLPGYVATSGIWTCPADGIYYVQLDAGLKAGGTISMGLVSYDSTTTPVIGWYSQEGGSNSSSIAFPDGGKEISYIRFFPQGATVLNALDASANNNVDVRLSIYRLF